MSINLLALEAYHWLSWVCRPQVLVPGVLAPALAIKRWSCHYARLVRPHFQLRPSSFLVRPPSAFTGWRRGLTCWAPSYSDRLNCILYGRFQLWAPKFRPSKTWLGYVWPWCLAQALGFWAQTNWARLRALHCAKWPFSCSVLENLWRCRSISAARFQPPVFGSFPSDFRHLSLQA